MTDRALKGLEAAFSRCRDGLLSTDAGRWALFVQPEDRRCQPKLVGCFDDEHQACSAGFRSTVGRRFVVKQILERDRVTSVPMAVPARRL